MKLRKTVSFIAVLALTASIAFAASVQDLYTDFTSAVDGGDVAGAIEAYDRMQEALEDERSSIGKDISKAIDKNDRVLYRNAVSDLRSLDAYTLTSADTDALLTAIVNSDSGDASQWAAWLYDNSRYYNPTLTLTTDVSGTGYRQSYRRSFSAQPGTEITLPSSMDVNPSAAGVLTGWGITPDEATYAPGETITMPYTDQTLFAIYSSRVVFNNDETGDNTVFTDVADGDVVEVPTPPDLEGAIFEGWYDRLSGQYIAPGETEYTVRGMGARFEALYVKLEASELECGHYDVNRIPTGVQLSLTFTLSNSGSEDLSGVSITVSSDSEYARLMNTEAYMRNMYAGQDYTLTGTRLVVSRDCPSGSQLPVTVTMTDSEGRSFTSTFTLTVK